jgi:transcriptional regulator with XRE-family HTH domain
MEAGTIKSARRGKGLSQEKLAEMMRVDATTIYRWEAGIVAPSITNMLRLKDILSKFDGVQHPLMAFLIDQPEAVALLDREAVYRKANHAFLRLVRMDADRLIGQYATVCMDFWEQQIFAETGKTPEELVVSDISEVVVFTAGLGASRNQPLRHQINIVRQEQFSAVLVHRIEISTNGERLMSNVEVVRRFGEAE